MDLPKREEYEISKDKSFDSINCLYGKDEIYNIYLHFIIYASWNPENVPIGNYDTVHKHISTFIGMKSIDFIRYKTGLGFEYVVAFHKENDCADFIQLLNLMLGECECKIDEYTQTNKKKNIKKLFEQEYKMQGI